MVRQRRTNSNVNKTSIRFRRFRVCISLKQRSTTWSADNFMCYERSTRNSIHIVYFYFQPCPTCRRWRPWKRFDEFRFIITTQICFVVVYVKPSNRMVPRFPNRACHAIGECSTIFQMHFNFESNVFHTVQVWKFDTFYRNKKIVCFYRNMSLRGLRVLCSIKQGKIFHCIKYEKLKRIIVL